MGSLAAAGREGERGGAEEEGEGEERRVEHQVEPEERHELGRVRRRRGGHWEEGKAGGRGEG